MIMNARQGNALSLLVLSYWNIFLIAKILGDLTFTAINCRK